MTEFESRRDELAGHRRTLDRERQEQLLAREAVRYAERALGEFARTETTEQGAEREKLQRALAAARARAAELEREVDALDQREAELFKAFEVFTDPREQLRQWSDRSPILLLPLRLETRFKTGVEGRPQLWVRVYPDSCLVDAFEPSLADQEITNGRAFWAAVWRAGGDEALERTAWRDLVASHGPGRAAWIVRQLTPLNPSDKPAKDNASDVVLIITAGAPLPPAASTYWMAAWRAAGDPEAEQAAYRALERDVGVDRAREIAERYRPFNMSDTPTPPRTRQDARVKVAVLQFADPETVARRRTSWSSAPRVELLPERFMFVAYRPTGSPLIFSSGPIRTPLIAGLDPNAPPDKQLKPIDDRLRIPDELKWMFDFDAALEAGMAVRIDLTPEQARDGFERLIVLGLRFRDSDTDGRHQLEALLEHHLYSRAGLELLPQGTPTNNTEKGGSGYTSQVDADATFDLFFRQTPQYSLENDPQLRSDGQWLAELLGLTHDLVRRMPHAGGRDQSEARAMQTALWPATLGAMMKTHLAPVFSVPDVDQTRLFLTRYVSGRGPVPALRIGSQPYGILPTAAFDRLNWFSSDGRTPYLGRLYATLKRIDQDWAPLVDLVSYVGKPGQDPHQVLLDVLGLHPSSVEYYPLQADSVDHKFFEVAFLSYSVALNVLRLATFELPLALLRSFGYVGAEVPDLLNKVFRSRQTPLDGPIVDDRPLSEVDPVRAYAAGKNYIEWLAEAAASGVEALQREEGFDEGKKPAAQLYLMLRHALQLAFYDTAVRLEVAAGVTPESAVLQREPAFVHVQDAAGSESRYARLFRADERITKSANLKVGDYIARNLRTVDTDLREQIDAIGRLARVPTARLERLFAEHVDCCSYRLDAWKMGLLALELQRMRSSREESNGLFLGCVGWVEPLRPENKVLTPVELPADVAEDVNRGESVPLTRDSTNAGLMHAPSLNHATTAAILRSGYLANDGRLAVDLSSRRVRLALEILEGMRGGQSLGALLGYQFERHVHDHGPLQVRDVVYHLRRAFPLAADQIASTKSETAPATARDAVAAMNVVDGRKLLEHAVRVGNFVYPFGVEALPRRDASQEGAITNALAHIRDINDAVADLVLAEGVHQAVLGNYDRSAGTLDAFAKGGYPPEPEVIRTPRTGIGLTLRTAIHLSSAPEANPLPTIPVSPLARAEPAVNAWLAQRLPKPADVGCLVTFRSRATDTVETPFITQEQLGLQPIDLVYLADANPSQALNDLDDRILRYVHTKHDPRHDRKIRMAYTQHVDGRVTWFELQALLRSLRSLVVASRPLQPADFIRANDASRDQQAAVSLPKSRVQEPSDLLDGLLPDLDPLATAIGDVTVSIDEALLRFAETVGRFAEFRLPQTGTGFVFERRARAYTAIVEKIQARVVRWNERLNELSARLAHYDSLPFETSEADRVVLLKAAEILVSTALTTPTPTSGAYRNALDDRRLAFETKRDRLRALVDLPRAGLASLLDDAKHELPLTDFDPADLDFTEDEAAIARFRADLKQAVARLKEDSSHRVELVADLLTRHDSADPLHRVSLLQEASKVLFGDDFQVVPHIEVPVMARAELDNAWQHSTSGDLTRHLTESIGRDFPVDDWLHGVARVREKMRHWENVVLLGDALQVTAASDLVPLQLPHQPGQPWLALEVPDTFEIDTDRLLYTAHFPEPFDSTQPLCGLLVDEWTEVIPGTTETTGIAFHYDRPDCEPPQAWLLVLPAARDGVWSWDDLLGGVEHALASAKRRALEPVHVGNTAYGWFLPATLSAYTFPEISISNNLLRNIQIYSRLAGE